MNYVPEDRTIPICICCGAELPIEPSSDATGLACDSCFAESEAKAATARQAERDDEFRWMSWNWFRTSYLERKPFMLDVQFKQGFYR